METVAGAPLILQVERPSRRMSRWMSKEPSSSRGRESRSSRDRVSSSRPVNRAETEALSVPVRTSSFEVRSPSTAWMASMIG